MTKDTNKPAPGETRFGNLANEPGIGMDNDGKLNIVGFDKDYAPGGPKDPNKGKK